MISCDLGDDGIQENMRYLFNGLFVIFLIIIGITPSSMRMWKTKQETNAK